MPCLKPTARTVRCLTLKEDDVKWMSKFFTSLWNLTKLYGEPENNTKYWEEFCQKSSELMTLYDGDPIVMKSVYQFHDYGISVI